MRRKGQTCKGEEEEGEDGWIRWKTHKWHSKSKIGWQTQLSCSIAPVRLLTVVTLNKELSGKV